MKAYGWRVIGVISPVPWRRFQEPDRRLAFDMREAAGVRGLRIDAKIRDCSAAFIKTTLFFSFGDLPHDSHAPDAASFNVNNMLISLVELGGFEPPTSAVRLQRSPI